MHKGAYKFTLDNDYQYLYDLSDYFVKIDSTKIENEWGSIEPDRIKINKEYAWDGCSGGVWQGKTIERVEWMPVVKDGGYRYTDTAAASLVHDYLYQFLYNTRKQTKLTLWKVRKLADIVFYDILIRAEFKYPKSYYYGVRYLGVTTYVKKWMDGRKCS